MAAPAAVTVSSWDLVAAAQRGDRDAFGQLWCRYAPVVAGYVRRRVRDHGLAEDLTSETFARAWRSIGPVRNQGRDVGAWFVTIARNLVRDHAKSHRAQREALVADVETVAAAGAAFTPASPGVERVVLARLVAAELRRRVAALPAAQRDVIRLRFGDGLSVLQVAAAVGRSESAVKALQHRALTQLRVIAGGER
ncbi:MAG: RNA polymerase sigma factor [Pseudonocardia sp.]